MSILDELDHVTRDLLERFGFDEARFRELRGRVASGVLSPESTRLSGRVEPPRTDDLTVLPEPSTPAYEVAVAAGLEALRAGKVAQVVLCGGMATRFGGVVKAIVEVHEGRSFLEVKLAETARLAEVVGARIPVALMTSFATDEAVRAHVGERRPGDARLGDLLVFPQLISLRLQPDGSLFLDDTGRPSPYSPGHGDLFEALVRSGVVETLRSAGVEHLAVSNVDNLGARVSPVVVGAHLLGGRPLTVEVTTKDGDTGGAPARVDGKLRLVEGPCFPEGFDQETIAVFNTNTAIVAIDAVHDGLDLQWLYMEKAVDERPAVQLERLYHELSARVPTTYLVVPRRGPTGRFMPVKVPADVARVAGDLAEMLAAPPA
ncbi:MAG: UTP--glucose-1-phosphate uridylyltransferase [Gaiellales bacterium]